MWSIVQDRRNLFYGEGAESKCQPPWMADDEKLKKTLAKTPSSSPQKRNLDQNVNDSKCHIWNSFYENIILGIRLFYIRSNVRDIIRISF